MTGCEGQSVWKRSPEKEEEEEEENKEQEQELSNFKDKDFVIVSVGSSKQQRAVRTAAASGSN
jgi:3-hydroxyisobutyrate dehydrogenase-like beta-hydroxyacid dehydrogenase